MYEALTDFSVTIFILWAFAWLALYILAWILGGLAMLFGLFVKWRHRARRR